MKIIRVFPRRTNATPDDNLVRIGCMPGLFDEADEIHISVSFSWDKDEAEKLAYQWEYVAPVKIGGPAYGDFGREFEPGKYLKHGYVITSRGCPNRCWFCQAWRNEGDIRELAIKDGWNVLDNNLLACSENHQEKVFHMLLRQKERIKFTGGFEARRFTDWHVEWMLKLKPHIVYFAYDEPDDWIPLVQVSRMLREAGLITGKNRIRCYVLIGYPGDTIEKAEKRLRDIVSLGLMPMAMLFNKEKRDWNNFQIEWARPIIVGYKMKHYQEHR